MGYLEATGLSYRLADGRQLFEDVSFRVAAGQVVALVGDNGAGKTTLLRLLNREIKPVDGSVSVQGGYAFMPQFIGSVRDDQVVRDLLLTAAPGRVTESGEPVWTEARVQRAR
ncbi:ATP-binding cassette domain-containing protein [Amycolatopsis sp. H20-H5]|uniref:ATP-binding cassette domain-containing protein n=1 Tax=Amycolatopsis sp. H20-H5 TaxID=3046309 RepID=UPI002DBDB0B8|nr:ATP-binding cassette domain-containing protein [Amycolatopsis sp. H20-H5]MEC3976443.1 ATP-binding cassette domain-containing protein [Amycolatopsis sp. H20-H5]